MIGELDEKVKDLGGGEDRMNTESSEAGRDRWGVLMWPAMIEYTRGWACLIDRRVIYAGIGHGGGSLACSGRMG